MAKEKKCIYCGLGESDGVKLSTSDIIPEALSNKKLVNYCVCEKEHNNRFSDKFESYVISKLTFIANRFGMFGKNTHLPPYSAKYKIDGMMLEKKKVINREDLLKGDIVPGTKDQKAVRFGKLEYLEKFTNFNPENFKELDISNIQITEQISIDFNAFFSHQAARFAAKVAYEWYCQQNSICDYDESKYKDIVDFIVNGTYYEDIVNIVVNLELYDLINNEVELGSHTLLTLYSSDRTIYILFSLFGLVIYKVKIRKSLVDFTDRQNITGISIRYDGFVREDIKISLSSDYLNKTVQPTTDAAKMIIHYILEKIRIIVNTQLLTLENFRYIVDDIIIICNSMKGDERYNELIGYNNERRIMALFILYNLGKNKKSYVSTLSFNDNLKNIFSVDEKIVLSENTYLVLKELYGKDAAAFLNLVASGIDIFNSARNN